VSVLFCTVEKYAGDSIRKFPVIVAAAEIIAVWLLSACILETVRNGTVCLSILLSSCVNAEKEAQDTRQRDV
jgi:hypothetical protein